MRVLSLFDGISCGRVAFDRAGLDVSEYHACEINKYAIKISERNYPDIIRHGSVVDYHPTGHFDYIIGGSPCQGFSFNGKQLALNDPRSALFFEYVRILKECQRVNPNIKFLLENVQMKEEHFNVISDYLGVPPLFVNSSLVSAQNRPRYYWANWRLTHPDDKGIKLKDILNDDVHPKDVRNPISSDKLRKKIEGSIRSLDDKAKCLSSQSCRTLGGCGATTIRHGNGYRRLSVLECERLQTLPDGYTEGVSDTQRYQALGNGWTVDVIAHFLKESV